ncbi:uncharacterized protein LOC131158822 [Malania oleifera]|uniref:uncharacterized protein LOC131158822 n=1 Tax=Malania oleifera TaxID=397392 RepID=UPI0025ADC8A7|nr:uncharacterized protein LOC131158822 [Malania oleifera]XP_057969703.1 uncharacterized protein LOC131158822 [Malania oleifera]XP_057969704.1 uncharacterized protein LOC131158822 [Malania oleifera]
MKGRSHRLPISDPPDDWIDESWTVDCVCGVNFDDGEEMVNCDECGVWVHTRCSRYVKGDASFACDKCKSKNSSRNDNEETEVAQLLVELPTKTMRMENDIRNSCPLSNPPRRPFRLWTDMPIEERVHVQGVPGGEPALFGGLSSVFNRELWKCSGYVPKKFNFQYREFPCWEEKREADDGIEEENENPVKKGAGVLFSLSKKNVLTTPVATLVGMRGQTGEDDCEGKLCEDLNVKHMQNGAKERSLLRPIVIHSSKRKKEDLGTSKDRSGKKKVKATDKESDVQKRGTQTTKPVFTPNNGAKQLEFYEDRGPKIPKSDTHNTKSENLKDSVAREPVSDDTFAVGDIVEKPQNSLAVKEQNPEAFSSDISKHNSSIGAGAKEDKAVHQVPATIEGSFKMNDGTGSVLERNDIGSALVNEEGVSTDVNNLDASVEHSSKSVVIDVHKTKLSEDMASAVLEIKDDLILQKSNGNISVNSGQPLVKMKTEEDFVNCGGVMLSSPSVEVKLEEINHMAQQGESGDHLPENTTVNAALASSSPSSDCKVQDIDRSSNAVNDCHIDKPDELSADLHQCKRELECSESSMVVQKSSKEPRHASELLEEPSKSGRTSSSPCVLQSQCKTVSGVEKSSSPSSSVMVSKSPISDNCKTVNSHNLASVTKQRVTCNISMKKDHAASDIVGEEDRHGMLRKTVKDRPKSSANSALKASHLSRIPHASVSKQPLPDSKDPAMNSFSKASAAHNVAVTSGTGESAGSLQTQRSLPAENKIPGPGLAQRGEKFSQSTSVPSSKSNHTSSTPHSAPSSAPTTLSDEELALLLHQELNSSPRVPRVPRVRHTGSFPPFASQTATSILIKRSSSSGGKDHSLVSRRRNKDVPKDGAHSSREIDDEAKKTDRTLPSPDQRRQDLAYTVDASIKRNIDDDSLKAVDSVKKNIPPAPTMAANSGPSSSIEANDLILSSTHNSPRNTSDDEAHQTLPGLISDIMSKGERMTYEELCDAVLPHWHNLRKNNGERYAYSSHSQAVLDCLRNRNEWSQLVDRGPKTNTSRKRRKLDAEPLNFDLDDKEYIKGRTVKEAEGKNFDSHREEFPKGKRKARKRRRLALQGREIRDVRKIRKADVLTDDDFGPFSNSSEESMFSEDEIQEGGTCLGGSEASISSDEMGTLL